MASLSPSFIVPLHRPVTHFYDRKQWELQSADGSLPIPDEDIQALIAGCNEPLVYNWIFQKRFHGRPYAYEDAHYFFSWAREGWENRTWFVFFIRDPNHQLMGAIDIKSTDTTGAEIGYWARASSRGIMTNTVLALCELAQEAGYQRLFALIDPKNERSIHVATKAGFVQADDILRDGILYLQFSKSLAA